MVADDRQRRTKLLVVDQPAAMIDVGDKGDRVEKARSAVGIAAEQHSSAFGAGFLDVGGDDIELHPVLYRAKRRRFQQAIADRTALA